jgi:hypothetical protein
MTGNIRRAMNEIDRRLHGPTMTGLETAGLTKKIGDLSIAAAGLVNVPTIFLVNRDMEGTETTTIGIEMTGNVVHSRQ